MTRRDTNPFLTITSTGGLLPVPLLERLTTSADDLKGTRPADYQLLPGKQLRDIINRSWNDLQGVWQSYRTHLDTLPDDDPATRATLERWVLPLLRELGFDTVHPANNTGKLYVDESALTDGRREWPITHEWGDRVPLHLLGANVPLDRRTPGVHGAANASPHSNVQDFLNASDRHLWAIVTNGRHLRILRDSTSLTRQAYLEFDLHTMFDNDVFVDFTLLWMLTHRTRFEGTSPADCWLETWQNTAHEQGVRALEDLRAGVRTAIEAFGTGLLEHPANTDLRHALQSGDLDRQDYYRQLLRLVYRLVFLFVIEDRDLLHPPDTDPAIRRRYADNYSTARLRDQARAHRGGRHPDGWEQLRTLFNGLASADGIPALGLPTLTGGLFDQTWTADVDNTSLANRHLFTAIRSLGYTQQEGLLQRIDYRNLGSEELGSVYESLLEMHPAIDPDARTVRLDTAAGNERRTTGAYYTPTSLISLVLDSALDPVIDQAVTAKPRDEAEEALLSLTVCDPAMGSAHFLVGAAHRLAKRLATIRTGDIEPDPAAVQQALRDVVSRCIYGVDVNPMAVELAKVSLWLECHVAGQPLTFLDHHLRCGNSLLGVHNPALLAWDPDARRAADQGGIPDAAFKALQGDDRTAATAAKNHNKTLRNSGRQAMLSFDTDVVETSSARLARQAETIASMPDNSVEALTAKQEAWGALEADAGLNLERLRADAYCAAYTILKTEQSRAERQQNPWDVFYATTSGQTLPDNNQGVLAARAEATQNRFFHWHLEFPDIHDAGGFDAMVGNPPWEINAIAEREWFAANGRDDIAGSKNTAARRKLIQALYEGNDPDRALAARWDEDQHAAQSFSVFARESGRFPLCGTGSINTFALFAETFTDLIDKRGRSGFIVPNGIVTDNTYRHFFGSLVSERRLQSVFSFINRERLFPEVAPIVRFAVLTVGGTNSAEAAEFAFYLQQPADLADAQRRYLLKPESIAAINPNTLTAPVFRSQRDADLAAKLYDRQPVVWREQPDENPWGLTFTRLFDMSTDSHLFETREDLEAQGLRLDGNTFQGSGGPYVPLYEGKLFHLDDHNAQTYEGVPSERMFNVKAGVNTTPAGNDGVRHPFLPRYWVDKKEVDAKLEAKGWEHPVMLAWRDITDSISTRACISAVLPRAAANHKCLVALPDGGSSSALLLQSVWGSFAFDYVVRQKLSGTNLAYFLMRQMACPAPDQLEPYSAWLLRRMLYLAGNTADMAERLGMDSPVVWEPAKRVQVRAEVDAVMFHLFGYDRDDAAYALSTFTTLARHENEAAGQSFDDPNFPTKVRLLTEYDKVNLDRDEPIINADSEPWLPDVPKSLVAPHE